MSLASFTLSDVSFWDFLELAREGSFGKRAKQLTGVMVMGFLAVSLRWHGFQVWLIHQLVEWQEQKYKGLIDHLYQQIAGSRARVAR
jgi:hypothetical protein